ncbi:MAG: UDP-N-acetylglucosamine 1-carboxyvinyltransferase [Anaerovoracaceae bacterium]
MAKFLVEKSGPLHGEVTISGAKNAVLPILAATLLTDELCEIDETPDLKDVEILCSLISKLGANVEMRMDKNEVDIEAKKLITCEAPFEEVTKMRASILVMGPMLARLGEAKIHLPGGCSIGERPVELHFKGLRAMGAEIDISDIGLVTAKAGKKLKGADIYLDFPSVGATENIMMAAALAEGITRIENAAQEPEIVDLANFINKMGGKVKGAGTDAIKIEGVEKLHGTTHSIIPDRIEAGTFMLAAAITRGDILIKNVVLDHVKPIKAKLQECGVLVEMIPEGMRVRGNVNPLVSADIKTLPYPGFPTDIQSPFMTFLATVSGRSVVIETVFENRFMHVLELNSMGARIKTEGKCAIVEGSQKLHGAPVKSTDLRAGAAMVLAGLVADGETEVSEIYHIERGYEHFVEKITALGGKIKKIED